ncbi:uncharacterized protein LOC135482167 isoform X2 [Liolophura sinensis]
MGAEESKPGSYSLMGTSAIVANVNRRALLARPWSLLHQCSLDQWRVGHSDAAGFSENFSVCNGIIYKDCSPAFCTSRQGIININKSSSVFSFRRKSKFTKMAEHFEYNHIPAQLSSIQNFHVKSVLCYHNSIVVLHLVRNLMTQFGVINLETNKFMGIFGKQPAEFVNEALLGKISPDESKCLIKLPQLKSRGNPFVFQLYDLKSKALIREIDLAYQETHFAFDPRFSSKRLAVTSYKAGEEQSLSLVRTDTWEAIATTPGVVESSYASLQMLVRDLFYSKDGFIIFAILVSQSATCQCREKKSRRQQPLDCSIYVFSADTGDTLHCIQFRRYICGQHSCLRNYMPAFSFCGSRMALVLNDQDSPQLDHVQVYKLPVENTLQNLCRITILQQFGMANLPKLPLPHRMIHYLYFKPEFA